ncbi:PSP1 domain-containing protein [Clostridium aminobutyricum]|uniref:Stage 0 sporulation family protein n=1 Tax=Clostridium aminobutyricum TaxID=33953 RepID=A0A939IJN0_CLOAM|nr:stage 0 sporulation family protein [Clostridium aminobutyricum]MBN7774266.1 stage 0 sporulation family protein [Clostridium aminobutyricum]
MVRVAGIRFKRAGKVYYFDPGDLEIIKDSNVIVETARGMEYGTVTCDIKEVPEKDIVAPLKKIIRIANEKDTLQHIENLKKKEKAIVLCQEKVNKHNLDMKLIDVEYTFDNSKIIFYFTADGRVDFRELVKDLAGVFKMRIELRQIGVRDEAKMVGGIGTCGKGLCCHTWLPEFEPVSIKMAKVQNLSLNPTKISGICGRLMCCLKFENDVYMELRKGMPEVGEKIKTPDGIGIVTESNILENKIKVRLILEERTEDKPEKLSVELYTYKKKDIRRIESNHKKDNKDIFEDLDEELLDEIKNLLKE